MRTVSPGLTTNEYLERTYHPDKDYLEGMLEDRNAGEKEHGKLQARLWALLKKRKLAAFIETRLRISPVRYRVPDVCAFEREPDESIFTHAPLLCIEILSPKDTLTRVRNVAEDYLSLQVPHVWVLDPHAKIAYGVEKGRGLFELTGDLVIGDRLKLTHEEVFSEADLF